jgi:hypothetical protein
MQIDYLEQQVKPCLTAAEFEYWSNVWKAAVHAAAKKMSDNRHWFYRFQGVSSAAAVVIPALVGLNLSGTGGTAVRWITFVVGLIGALAAAALKLFRVGPRWQINRHYYADLIGIGRSFGMDVAASGSCGKEQWENFQQKVGDIIVQFNNVYDSEVISPTQPGGPPRGNQ